MLLINKIDYTVAFKVITSAATHENTTVDTQIKHTLLFCVGVIAATLHNMASSGPFLWGKTMRGTFYLFGIPLPWQHREIRQNKLPIYNIRVDMGH